jgi:hypothetical protein
LLSARFQCPLNSKKPSGQSGSHEKSPQDLRAFSFARDRIT